MNKTASIVIRPRYSKYFMRSVKYVRVWLSIGILVPLILFIINERFIYILFSLAFVAISLINSLIINRYHLCEIEINEELKKLKLFINKANSTILNEEFDLDEIELSVVKLWYSKYPKYILNIKHNNAILIRQYTTGGWNTNLFMEVLNSFNRIQGKPIFTDYIRRN